MFNSMTFLQEGAQKIVDLYMGTFMSLQRPTGWIGFFTLSDGEGSIGNTTLEDGTLSRKPSHLENLNSIIDVFTLSDMIMRFQEINFGSSDVSLESIIMPDGKALIENYITNNKFTVKILESPLTSIDGYLSSWQREIYNPAKKALRAYQQFTRDREPYKRDLVAFYINWYMNIPVITHFKGASGCFPLSHTLNDEIRTYDETGPGMVSAEFAADSVNTIIVNQGTLFKNW